MLLVHDLVIDCSHLAKMLGWLEHVARFVEVPTHADRTVITILALRALAETIPRHGTNTFRRLRFEPHMMQCVLIAIPQRNACKTRTRIVVTISAKAKRIDARAAHFPFLPFIRG